MVISTVGLDFYKETVLALRIIAPGNADGLRGGLLSLKGYRRAQERRTVSLADTIDVVLDIGIAIGSLRHSIILLGIGAVLLFPFVGHTVAVSIGRLLSGKDLPCGRSTVDH